jgi:hypothetical protein
MFSEAIRMTLGNTRADTGDEELASFPAARIVSFRRERHEVAARGRHRGHAPGHRSRLLNSM